jgi:hypothetical protein
MENPGSPGTNKPILGIRTSAQAEEEIFQSDKLDLRPMSLSMYDLLIILKRNKTCTLGSEAKNHKGTKCHFLYVINHASARTDLQQSTRIYTSTRKRRGSRCNRGLTGWKLNKMTALA